jgi:Protein of unknown function (DUF3489)
MTGYLLEQARLASVHGSGNAVQGTYRTMADQRKGAATKVAGTGKLSSKSPETKMSRLEAMLRRPEGATIAQIVSTLGWQGHRRGS